MMRVLEALDENCGEVIVVGDCFSDFAKLQNVITATKLIRALDLDDGTGFGENLQHRQGQGLTLEQRMQILKLVRSKGLSPWFRDWIDVESRSKASQLITHKCQPQNILITEPEKIAEDMFGMAVDIDGRNELLLDHLTGLHIQGMLLKEASRQAFIAVSERYYLRLYPEKSYYFVIHNFSTKYINFLFPIEATLFCSVVRKRISNSSKLGFEMKIEIMQCGEVAASVNVDFTAFDAGFISDRERDLAIKCIARFNGFNKRMGERHLEVA